jgi:hypothetical protein
VAHQVDRVLADAQARWRGADRAAHDHARAVEEDALLQVGERALAGDDHELGELDVVGLRIGGRRAGRAVGVGRRAVLDRDVDARRRDARPAAPAHAHLDVAELARPALRAGAARPAADGPGGAGAPVARLRDRRVGGGATDTGQCAPDLSASSTSTVASGPPERARGRVLRRGHQVDLVRRVRLEAEAQCDERVLQRAVAVVREDVDLRRHDRRPAARPVAHHDRDVVVVEDARREQRGARDRQVGRAGAGEVAHLEADVARLARSAGRRARDR